MKNKALIVLPIFILLLLPVFFPDTYPFSPFNTGSQGTSYFYNSFENITSSNVTILILMENINNITPYLIYLLKGNTIIITGNYSSVNDFLHKLNASVIIAPVVLTSNLYYYMNNEIIIVNESSYTLIFPYAHPIIGGIPLVKVDNNSIITYYQYGSGKIIIISTPYFFLNKYYKLFNNSEYLHEITGTNKIRIIIYAQDSPLSEFKEFLLSFKSLHL
ncbi:MAG: hypothetical protein QXY87_10860 [Saccharolobus sp.]|uniref:hypothetical protein n=1 Tax=Saccharolobus TaxID=2100760 RepID=UPI001F1002A9|nr:hypothetical protein [Saccharolobus shibatae]MCH4816730.1 hypothetical protein [Saccharolobus shibatae]